MSTKGTAMTLPMRDPDGIHVLQLTDFVGNHNKFYELRVWYDGPWAITQAKYARVGNTAQETIKRVPRYEVDKLLTSKYRKGYQAIDPQNQVRRGRELLDAFIAAYEAAGAASPTVREPGAIAWGELRRQAEAYYNTVPSALPSSIVPGSAIHKLYFERDKERAKLERMRQILAVNYVTPDQAEMSEFLFLEIDVAATNGSARRARAAKATGISYTATIWDAIEV